MTEQSNPNPLTPDVWPTRFEELSVSDLLSNDRKTVARFFNNFRLLLPITYRSRYDWAMANPDATLKSDLVETFGSEDHPRVQEERAKYSEKYWNRGRKAFMDDMSKALRDTLPDEIAINWNNQLEVDEYLENMDVAYRELVNRPENLGEQQKKLCSHMLETYKNLRGGGYEHYDLTA